MKIVVLDGYTLNPGDLSWHSLEELGDATIYERTPEERIIERASGAEIVLTNKTPLKAETLAKLPDLRYIGVLATGYDVVDIQAASRKQIVVTNVPEYGTKSVAQMVFALLLELCNKVQLHSDAVKRGEWARNPDWCFWKAPLIELAGKTMGIIGYGRIGEQVARIALAMGMNVVANRRSANKHHPFVDLKGQSFQWVDLQELLRISDVISLHCPLTQETKGLINKESLRLMKPTSFLINTARGGLVVDADLADALNHGVIAGAALDVLSKEPPGNDNPLLTAKNCLITPHIAWASKEARQRLLEIAVNNIQAFLEGKPVNVVNKD
jgi:glycerate dehydrogenase